MTRVGIIPPPITITADDKRLKAGKPAPDPFLAAKCLRYDAPTCVVFERGCGKWSYRSRRLHQPERSKIANCGVHYIVENMESVTCEVEGNKLRFTVSASILT
jgi:hypothetical protein